MSQSMKTQATQCPGKKHAFTLIELLVVVSIIALLVSILLPALSRARDQARTVMCMANQKQLHLATQLYVEDSDGYWPYFNTDLHPVYGANTPWDTVICMYLGGGGSFGDVGDSEYFTCPSAEQKNRAQRKIRTYAMNTWFGYEGGGSSWSQPFRRDSEVQQFNNLVLYGDGQYADISGGWTSPGIGIIPYAPYFTTPDTPHNDKCILTFTNGSINQFAIDKIVGSYSDNYNTLDVTWIP